MEVTNLPGSISGRQTHRGVFGLAEIELSFGLECINNFYSPNCDVFCLENCTIDGCIGVSCGQNQRCVDQILGHTCVCEPGYTGPDCSTEFDACVGVSCNSGTCVGGMGSYTCVCDPGYTGQLCDRQLDRYELQVTIHSFRNPEGMCAHTHCGPQFCCEATACPNSCDYYFSLCLRPVGKPVSFTREIYQGACATFDTIPSRKIRDGATFTNRLFGSTSNPVPFTQSNWVSRVLSVA